MFFPLTLESLIQHVSPHRWPELKFLSNSLTFSPLKAIHLDYRGPANLNSFIVGVRLVLNVTNLEKFECQVNSLVDWTLDNQTSLHSTADIMMQCMEFLVGGGNTLNNPIILACAEAN